MKDSREYLGSQLWDAALWYDHAFRHLWRLRGYVADSILQRGERTTNRASVLAAASLSRLPTCLGSWPIYSVSATASAVLCVPALSTPPPPPCYRSL